MFQSVLDCSNLIKNRYIFFQEEIMRVLLLFLFFILQMFSVSVQGKEYYIDSVAGKETNDGRSPQTAWRSLAKANFYHYAGADTWDANIVRYNISYNDGEKKRSMRNIYVVRSGGRSNEEPACL